LEGPELAKTAPKLAFRFRHLSKLDIFDFRWCSLAKTQNLHFAWDILEKWRFWRVLNPWKMKVLGGPWPPKFCISLETSLQKWRFWIVLKQQKLAFRRRHPSKMHGSEGSERPPVAVGRG
jgi:hypothetical protein